MATKDEQRLKELGYDQELQRGWGLLNNFGVSFSIISICTGLTTLFSYGLTTGGPAVMTIGWLVVCFFTSFVALGMAEITSAVPSAGGPYYWSAVLSPPKQSAFWAWLTGWFNFLGQVAVTTSVTYGLAGLISTLAAVDGTYEPTPAKTVAIHIGLLLSHALVNTFGIRLLAHLNNLSIALHSLGIFAFCVAVLAKAPSHQSASFVFGKFQDSTAQSASDQTWGERASSAYVVIIGILTAQFTITGFDASAHLSEETTNAERNAPIGIILSVGVAGIFGFFFLLALLFSVQDFERVLDSEQPVLQILIDLFGMTGAKVLFSLIIICVWHAGLFSLTSNSRMFSMSAYVFSIIPLLFVLQTASFVTDAFARDGALPKLFTKVDKKYQAPVATVWLAALLALILALPSLGSEVAFAAATSIATIGLYISYGLPILLGLFHPWTRGPFHLGKFSKPVAFIACGWVVFITIVFCLPTINPVNRETLNYAPVAVGIVFAGIIISWFTYARKHFQGPIKQLLDEGIVDPSRLAGHLDVIPSSTKDAEEGEIEKREIGDVNVRPVRSFSTSTTIPPSN